MTLLCTRTLDVLYPKRHDRFIDKYLSIIVLWYLALIGIVGALMNLFDLMRIINYGPTLPLALKAGRIKHGQILFEETERNLKFLATFVHMNSSLSLTIGLLIEWPVLLYPWILLQSLMVVTEFIVFFINSTTVRKLCISYWACVCSVFAAFNLVLVYSTLHDCI